jgi:hypothetical protein
MNGIAKYLLRQLHAESINGPAARGTDGGARIRRKCDFHLDDNRPFGSQRAATAAIGDTAMARHGSTAE